MAKKPVTKKLVAKKPVKTKKIVPPPMVDSFDEDYPTGGAMIPDGGYEDLGAVVVEVPASEPFDDVIVSSVPECEEKTGHVIKMNYFNAAGQLVR